MTSVQEDAGLSATTEIREGEYGEKVAVIEPGGAEFIPLAERHGTPGRLFWTWMSPNFEFATVFLGVLAVAAFGLSFWQAVAAIVLGTVLGSASHGALSARGPQYGVPQMVLSRISFGHWGNALPATINAIIAGVGWFAVNSVSGALALSSLIHLNKYASLVVIVVAQLAIALFGHNLVHLFERVAAPLLIVSFGLGAIWTFSKGHYSQAGHPIPGGFLIAVAATFGYACGWNPFASDYTRYMAPDSDKKATAWWAGFGVALSCIFLEIVGAASATYVGAASFGGPGPFVAAYPTWVSKLVLLSIAIGAIAANAINIYSGSISFTAIGFKIPSHLRRALIAGVFGVAGFVVAAIGIDNIDKYENFLLIISYWVGPWLAVFFVDQLLNRGNHADVLYDHKYTNWAGPIAMAVGMAVSISLFSNQTKFIAYVPKHHGGVGDLTFEVGFVLAGLVYYVLYRAGLGPNKKAVASGG
jgi:NCS1 family nucleobase:cation symporter-1